MDFLALAAAILTMYTSVSAQQKDSLDILQQSVVENKIMEYVEREAHFKPSDKFKEELISFLEKHGADSECNRRFLEIFLTNKTYDEMADATLNAYIPVSKMAGSYDLLDSKDQARVRNAEAKILNTLRTKYKFVLDSAGKKDFIALIRKHGIANDLNYKLIRQFFSCTKSKLFDQIVSFMKPYKKGITATELRRKLQANPDIFGVGALNKKRHTLQSCHNSPARNKREPRGGKRTLI